jgi:peptidoglycan/LPS O-acetylase OafA/YrhL
MILTGLRVPVISQPDLGVDLFILLSGFLMVFQYQLRSRFEDWDRPSTWGSFWARRFFRIAPLFYFTLAIALIAGPYLYADRMVIDGFFGRPPQPAQRYLDSSVTNILAHVTFLFGLLPRHAYRTALPDWSLGLEMQFYAVFPFLILLQRRLGWIATALIAGATGALIAIAISRLGIRYPMPAFLPLKLHLFLAGMLIAAAMGQSRRILAAYLVLGMLLAALPFGGHEDVLHLVAREMLVIGFFALVHFHAHPALNATSAFLGSKPLHWLGELSFGAYLIHLLILQPVVARVITAYGTGIDAPARFLIVAAIVAPVTYACAFATYRLFEVPGQKLGKAVIKLFANRPAPASQVAPESIAAP